jgi:glycosyltransferase involved in cell wall biosynthesis
MTVANKETSHRGAPNTTPMVSILIPTYNRASLLQQAIRSALSQTYDNLEIVVSDNASTDETSAILAQQTDSRITLLRQTTNVGPIRNINACLGSAQGEFVLVLSDDDLLLPHCIARMMEQCLMHPAATVAYGQTRKETTDGQLIVTTRPSPTLMEPGLEFVMQWIDGRREVAFCCTMFRRSHLLEIGGFPAFPACDAAARAAVALRGDVLHIPEVLAIYRVHALSDSHSFSTRQWVKEDLAMVDYIAGHVPDAKRADFRRLGRGYATRASGRRLGDDLTAGLSAQEAWTTIRYCGHVFGWSALLRWPWAGMVAKSLLPANTIHGLRDLRNNSRTATRRRIPIA